MRWKSAMAALVIAQALIVVSAQGKSTQDGVYTDAQGKRGEAVYTRACAGCHQPDLAGNGQAPALTGKDFNMDFTDGPVFDLFDRTSSTMPADKPGSLTPAEAADVVAYLLSKAGAPAGPTELPTDTAALKAIKFVAPKP